MGLGKKCRAWDARVITTKRERESAIEKNKCGEAMDAALRSFR
jgi:hypothetical protein